MAAIGLLPQRDDAMQNILGAQLLHHLRNGPITIAIRARFEYDSTTIRLQHATTRYEVFRVLAYEIVYENQW